MSATKQHDDFCEADWGPEGQESPCRCPHEDGSVTITVRVPSTTATKAVEAIEDVFMEAGIDWDLDTDWTDE